MKSTQSLLRSIQPRKQRKYRYTAPLHRKQKLLHAHLSPILRKKYGKRSLQIKQGDKAKVLRGQFKRKEGKVERVSLKQERVFITGIELVKKDGTKVQFPISPSNLLLVDLNLDDKKRKRKLTGKTEKVDVPVKEEKAVAQEKPVAGETNEKSS